MDIQHIEELVAGLDPQYVPTIAGALVTLAAVLVGKLLGVTFRAIRSKPTEFGQSIAAKIAAFTGDNLSVDGKKSSLTAGKLAVALNKSKLSAVAVDGMDARRMLNKADRKLITAATLAKSAEITTRRKQNEEEAIRLSLAGVKKVAHVDPVFAAPAFVPPVFNTPKYVPVTPTVAEKPKSNPWGVYGSNLTTAFREVLGGYGDVTMKVEKIEEQGVKHPQGVLTVLQGGTVIGSATVTMQDGCNGVAVISDVDIAIKREKTDPVYNLLAETARQQARAWGYTRCMLTTSRRSAGFTVEKCGAAAPWTEISKFTNSRSGTDLRILVGDCTKANWTLPRAV